MAAVAMHVAAAGCGQRDPRVTIQGTVTIDGGPLPTGVVVFTPDEKSLRAEGAAVKEGNFTIRVHKGPHRVEIHAQVEERLAAVAGAPPETGITLRSIIPPEYNEKSTLSFDVQSSKDRPAFDLSSGKHRPQ